MGRNRTFDSPTVFQKLSNSALGKTVINSDLYVIVTGNDGTKTHE